ncbi:hypothetical protein DITRI_Ditri18aG0051300 [Diplodiscus trichospermus]
MGRKTKGVRAIIRDSKGFCLGAYAAMVPWTAEIQTIEIQAAIKAMEFALQMGFKEVIIEGDVSGIINGLATSSRDLSNIGTLVEERTQISKLFTKVSFMYTKRGGNKAAHALAKMGSTCTDDNVWVDDCPTSI